MRLYSETAGAPELRARRPKPSFKVVVLYVDEATSLARQLDRQRRSAAHNQKVIEARAGALMCAPDAGTTARERLYLASQNFLPARHLGPFATDNERRLRWVILAAVTAAWRVVRREERVTDKDAEKCRTRYSVFRRHYPALARLQAVMPFSIIDATGSLEECEAQVRAWP